MTPDLFDDLPPPKAATPIVPGAVQLHGWARDNVAALRAQQGRLVILDEMHRAPSVFEVLRGIIDDNRRAEQRGGQFLLLGSAALELMRQSSQTLAGRVLHRQPVAGDEQQIPV